LAVAALQEESSGGAAVIEKSSERVSLKEKCTDALPRDCESGGREELNEACSGETPWGAESGRGARLSVECDAGSPLNAKCVAEAPLKENSRERTLSQEKWSPVTAGFDEPDVRDLCIGPV
jgi:hypothetical protein